MGVTVFARSLGGGYDKSPPNPDPDRFSIVQAAVIGSALVAEVKYVGCTHFEGHKILVFKNRDLAWLKSQSRLDPHFYEGSPLVARFAPTSEGRLDAIRFAGMVQP